MYGDSFTGEKILWVGETVRLLQKRWRALQSGSTAVHRRGGGGVGTRPWWLALLACGGAYWPLAFEPSAMTSRQGGGGGIAVTERQIQLRKIAGNCGWIAVP